MNRVIQELESSPGQVLQDLLYISYRYSIVGEIGTYTGYVKAWTGYLIVGELTGFVIGQV